MTDRLDALEAKLAELSAQLEAARTLADRNDDFANGLWVAVQQLLMQLREHQPKVIEALQESWTSTALRYEALRDGAQREEWEPTLEHMEARAKLASALWPRPSTAQPSPPGGSGTAKHVRQRGASGARAR